MNRLLALFTASLLAPSLLQASHLPIKTYTTADGLARDHILCIAQDSRGFLWLGTAEGLSRFDGYRFTNYQIEQGLPSSFVEDFLETRAGVYWIATHGGLCRFDPAGTGPSRFIRTPLGGASATTTPSVLYEDPSGGVWCGAASGDGGLFRFDPGEASFRRVDLPIGNPAVTAVLVDRRGTLWVGGPDGLVGRAADGTTRHLTAADGLPSNSYVMALLEDREGSAWVGTRGGLIRMEAAEKPGGPRGSARTAPGTGSPRPASNRCSRRRTAHSGWARRRASRAGSPARPRTGASSRATRSRRA